MAKILFYITLVLYGFATLMYLFWLMRTTIVTGNIARNVLLSGFLVHVLALLHRFVSVNHLPIANMHDSLSFFGVALVGIYLAVEHRYKITSLGSFVTPVAFLTMLGSSTFANELKPLDPLMQNAWIYSHTILAFVSYALFTISGGTAAMYLIQSHLLKTKYQGHIFQKLPSLEKLDDISYRCLNIGFPMLTVAIITGAMVATKVWGSYWSWDPKQTCSLITWLVYAVLLHGRLAVGWRGKRAALFSLAGIILLLFSFVGVNLWFPGLHAFK
jgi:cytochrome c-type biogenesis protein CcsB